MHFVNAAIYNPDFDPSGWTFHLHTDGSGDVIAIEGRRIGAPPLKVTISNVNYICQIIA